MGKTIKSAIVPLGQALKRTWNVWRTYKAETARHRRAVEMRHGYRPARVPAPPGGFSLIIATMIAGLAAVAVALVIAFAVVVAFADPLVWLDAYERIAAMAGDG